MNFIKNHSISSAIIIFIIIFVIFTLLKPSFLFTKNGTIRNFGLGKRNATILPIWLFVIIIAIFAYLFILYYQRY